MCVTNAARMMLLVPLALPMGAWARSPGDTSFAVLLGSDTSFDGDPATFRLTVLGGGRLIQGDLLGFDVVVPATWMTSGENRFGVSTRNTAVEIPPSLRLELLPRLPVRPYGDLGVGLVVATTTADSWMFDGSSRAAGWMTRSALGVELGPPGGVMFIVEPLTARTYHLEGHYARVGSMVGVGGHF